MAKRRTLKDQEQYIGAYTTVSPPGEAKGPTEAPSVEHYVAMMEAACNHAMAALRINPDPERLRQRYLDSLEGTLDHIHTYTLRLWDALQRLRKHCTAAKTHWGQLLPTMTDKQFAAYRKQVLSGHDVDDSGWVPGNEAEIDLALIAMYEATENLYKIRASGLLEERVHTSEATKKKQTNAKERLEKLKAYIKSHGKPPPTKARHKRTEWIHQVVEDLDLTGRPETIRKDLRKLSY